MAILGTSVSDPNYYQRQGLATGQALASFIGALSQRRERKDQAAQQEINSAFKLMAEYPELADGPYAQSLRDKYKDHPEVPGLLDVISKRNQLAQQIPAAGAEHMKLWTGLQSTYQSDHDRLAQMPDTTDVNVPLDPLHMMFMQSSGVTTPPHPPLLAAGSTAPEALRIDSSPFFSAPPPQPPLRAAANATLSLPNPEKISLAKKLEQTKPELFPLTALQSMSPDKQLQASIWLKSQGYNLPDLSVIDQLKMLPEHVRAQRMVELGMVPPGLTADVVSYENKLAVPPATKEILAHEDQAQAASRANRLDEMHESDRLQRERAIAADGLRKAAQERSLANQEELVDYRSAHGKDGAEGDVEVSYKTILADSKSATKDWDQRSNVALKGITGKGAREKAIGTFMRENGPRPVPIPEIVARRIASQIKDQGLSTDDATEAAVQATATYQAERRRGAAAMDALGKALGEVVPGEERAKAEDTAREAKRSQLEAARQTAAGQAVEGAPGPAGARPTPPPAPQAAPGDKPPAGPGASAAPAPAAKPPGAKIPSIDEVRATVRVNHPELTPAQQEKLVAWTMAQMR